ncbi:MAG: nucleotidyltransferase domain-containing protein [Myxococcota bacterium]
MSFEDVASAVAASPAVAAAWVFGSVARNEARPDSDLDVALLLRDPEATAVTCRRDIQDLAARLETVSSRRVDLVVLTLRDPIIAQRVLSEGRLVLDADPERRIGFCSNVLARYLDWAPRYEAAARQSLATIRAWAERQGS